jgi:hypothetical protein
MTISEKIISGRREIVDVKYCLGSPALAKPQIDSGYKSVKARGRDQENG